ncbi:MAG: response regulator [Spirochaetia bacterium]|jgi:DNA-binding NtrC family response regulator
MSDVRYGVSAQGTETVMVVEDQPEVRALTIRILELAGYIVVGVENGRAAVTLLRKQPVHLIVLDMMLEPSFDGLDCYREAVAIQPGQKAIIVSGYADIERVAEAQRLGAGRHIKKPFTAVHLLQAVREELGDR